MYKEVYDCVFNLYYFCSMSVEMLGELAKTFALALKLEGFLA